MPKKTARNGFYYFMLDFKKKEEKLGRHFPGGLKEIQADQKCSDEWRALSTQKKKEYNDRAKRDKMESKEKLTGLGESVSEIRRQELLKRKYEENMKLYIDNVIDQAELLNSLESVSYYFIHVNYFYTKTDLHSKTDYIPAEFAVCEFSIKNGRKRLYHQIINTTIELGYARETTQISDSTHKLNPDLSEGERDYKIMCNKLIDFLRHETGAKEKLPPLYTTCDLENIVPCLLKRMTAAADAPEDTFDLYSFEYLFGSYMKYLDPEVPDSFNCINIARAQLDKGAFVWSPKIECSYHLGIENSRPYCSQAVVQQWIFTFCDFCCPRLNVEMRSGIHYPDNDSLECRSLTKSLQSLSLKEKFSMLKSETGVSAAYREMVSGRTKKEEEERRKRESHFTIIDHGKLNQEKSEIASNAIEEPGYKPYKPMRPPKKTMARLLDNFNQAPHFTEEDFPSIGGGRGRGSYRNNKKSSASESGSN